MAASKKCRIGALLGDKIGNRLLEVVRPDRKDPDRMVARDEKSGVLWSFTTVELKKMELVREAPDYVVPDFVEA